VLSALSDLIAGIRRDIWHLEEKLGHEFYILDRLAGGPTFQEVPFIQADMPALRVLKSRLQGYVECRAKIAQESLPADAENWWLSWEQHGDPTVGPVLPKSPWVEVVWVGGPANKVIVPAAQPTAIPYPGCLPFTPGSTPNGNYIQSDFLNYEMVIRHGNKVSHFWRDNNDPSLPWLYGSDVPIGSRELNSTVDSVSLFQDDFPSRLYPHGNFEVLIHSFEPIPQGVADSLATYYFDFKAQQWFGPFTVIADRNPVTGVTGKPVIIQSDFGNFEMVVPQGDTLMHYWRDNSDGGQPWQYANHPWHKGFEILSPIFGHKTQLGRVGFFRVRGLRAAPAIMEISK
jgi:hypothetical protein